MFLFVKSIRTENFELKSNLPPDQLANDMKAFSKNNSSFKFNVGFGERPNLDVFVNSNDKIEISPFWQFIQIPGFGMNVRMKGTIVKSGNCSQVTGNIKPHIFYVLLFWSLLFTGTLSILFYLLRITEKLETLYIGLLFNLLICPAVLVFCFYNKKKLIETVSETFNLYSIPKI